MQSNLLHWSTFQRWTLVTYFFLYLNVSGEDDANIFQAHQDPSGRMLTCFRGDPRNVSNIRSRIECAMQCMDDPSCTGFNFWKRRSCELFNLDIDSPLTFRNDTSEDQCRYYYYGVTPMKRPSLPVSCSPLNGEVPPECCTFPFTWNDQLFYQCTSTPLGCFSASRSWFQCRTQVSAIRNVTVNIEVPTYSFPTTVTSVNGWIVIQQRIDGSTSFDRSWTEYKNGFGHHQGNFWIGLERIYQVTNNIQCRVRFEYQMADDNDWLSDEYNTFILDPEALKYRIHVTGYAGGDNGDIMNSATRFHNGQPFTTPGGSTCADTYSSGWWFGGCIWFNMNGVYGTSGFEMWRYSRNNWIPMITTRIMIKAN